MVKGLFTNLKVGLKLKPYCVWHADRKPSTKQQFVTSSPPRPFRVPQGTYGTIHTNRHVHHWKHCLPLTEQFILLPFLDFYPWPSRAFTVYSRHFSYAKTVKVRQIYRSENVVYFCVPPDLFRYLWSVGLTGYISLLPDLTDSWYKGGSSEHSRTDTWIAATCLVPADAFPSLSKLSPRCIQT